MSLNQSPILVSVLLPCYNARDKVEVALKSIIEQTYTHLEIIVIDDGSTDDTYKILTKLSQEDARIKLYQNKSNLKLAKTLNRGIKLSKGKYIARMDADDISLSHRIAEQVAFMESHSDVMVCGSYMRTLRLRNRKIMKRSTADWRIRLWSFFYCSMFHPTVMMRRSFIEKYHILYKEEYNYAEDYQFWIDCMKYGKLANIPKTLLLYRFTPTQISQKHHTEQVLLAKKIGKAYRADRLKNRLKKLWSKKFFFNRSRL